MTDEELRQIDVAVHREIFGFTDIRLLNVYREPECGNWRIDSSGMMTEVFDGKKDWCFLPKYDHDGTEDAFCEIVPHYSTSIEAAYRVVERLVEEQYVKVYMRNSHYHGESCRVVAPDPTQMFDNPLVKCDSDSFFVPETALSMPHSICVAALQAVRGKS